MLVDLINLLFVSLFSFSKNVAAACLWDADSIDLYSKVQEMDFGMFSIDYCINFLVFKCYLNQTSATLTALTFFKLPI